MSDNATIARLERRIACLELLERIALVSNDLEPRDDVLRGALALVCDFTGWQVGHVYWAQGTETVPSTIWHLTDPERFAGFVELTERTVIVAGQNLPGRVLASGRPSFIADLETEPAFERLPAAREAGLASGVAFPVLAGAETVAVVEFYYTELGMPDDALFSVMGPAGVLLGRVVERDRAAQQQAEAERQRQRRERQLAEAQKIALVGSWDWEIETNRLTWSDEMYRRYGVDPSNFDATYEAYSALLHPEDREHMHETVQRALETGSPFETVHRIVRPDGEVRWIQARGGVYKDDRGRVVRMAGTGQDITDRIEAERHQRELMIQQERNRALEISNRELEQFAYIASHDLQEPLRTISGYLQLLARRYRDNLDRDAAEFIEFAVAGAQRMQQLIEDLLAYSRVTTKARPFAPVALEDVVATARENLAMRIAETRAEIAVAELPQVSGDRIQLIQLMQNVIGNAIKFAGDRPPRIEIDGQIDRSGERCTITVTDHGIGFDGRFSDRVFQVFQRAHGREYEGTGIGLAICKKIVERHGGEIEARSAPGEGTSIGITLPLA